MRDKPALCYQDAGVDINAGNELVDRIKPIVKQTYRSEVMGGVGGFAALCSLPQKYHNPILVSSTDGVGTKLRLAMALNHHENIGIDLVAMCVNDLIVQGAEPLFFLDYYATGKLNVDLATTVITGIAEGCKQAGCALIGGETAEMPGMYHNDDYDLAGFSVGVVEKSNIIDGSNIVEGDALLALSSSGPHANGYSLIRKIIEINHSDPAKIKLNNYTLAELLLAPTKIYVKSIQALLGNISVHAICHLTGGGFWENIPRILPANVTAIINENSWSWPDVFNWLQITGNISQYEMYRTFNCGVGMLIVVPASQVPQALAILHDMGEVAWQIGQIHAKTSDQSVIITPA